MTITESLKRFRNNRKLTQRNVAMALNISPQLYNYYESKGDLSVVTLLKIATTYGVSADYLLGLSDNPTPPKSQEDNSKLIVMSELLNQMLKERGLTTDK